ncbi:hypothetical protein Tcan_13776 [Toxocara canis]|uniref:PID domain-containing protein n=1 Tax=Toxocara canis TaxID=6265 RepID=A0A0B2VW11_TOXCA|nr:hypothetical protein Tcan_13776 [Toxocara canis]
MLMSTAIHPDNFRHLYYLGVLESAAVGKDRIGFAGGDKSVERRSSDERLIELVENAQLKGDLPKDAKGCQQVAVSVSKHGLKVTVEAVEPNVEAKTKKFFDDNNYTVDDPVGQRQIGTKEITDLSNGNVLDRVALLSIVQCVSFDDGFGNTNVVFLVQKPLSSLMQCYLFQANSAADADHLTPDAVGDSTERDI